MLRVSRNRTLGRRKLHLVEIRESCRRISSTQSSTALVQHQGGPQFVPPNARNDRSVLVQAMHGLFGKRLCLVLKAA